MTPQRAVDQLAIVTTAASQVTAVTDMLTGEGYSVTQVDSDGGVLSDPTTSLFVGLSRERLPRLLEIVRECCSTRRRLMPAHAEAAMVQVEPMVIEVEVGGATVYTLNVERFEQL